MILGTKNEMVFGNLYKIFDFISEKKSRGFVFGFLGYYLFIIMFVVCNEIYIDSIIKVLFYNVGKLIS